MDTSDADAMESGDIAPGEMAPDDRGSQSRSRWQWLAATVVALGIVSLGIAGVLYWQERTLRAAQRELHEGNPRRALGLVAYFLDAHPEHGGALALKARALCANGQTTEAIELYERMGAATAEDLHVWAHAYLHEQSWSRALPVLTQVLRLEPDDADALYEITSCRVRLGLLKDALESASRLAETSDQAARGMLFQAVVYQDMGNPTESLKAYQQVVDLAPDGQGLQVSPEELFTQYGLVLTTQGQSEAAVKWLQKSLAVRPTPAAYYYLGNAHSQTGNTAEAVKAWQESLKLDPAGVPVYEALAGSALQKGDLDAAQKWLTPLERFGAIRRTTAYLFQQLCAKRKDAAGAERWRKQTEELRKREQRQAAINQLLLDRPYGFWTAVVRAHRFAEQGNWRQARDMIEQLASDEPDEPFVQELTAAIRKGGPLPSLERLPIKLF